MKKLIILLFFLLSFAFSGVSVFAEDDQATPITGKPEIENQDRTYNLLAPIGNFTKIDTAGTCPGNPTRPADFGCYLNIVFKIAIGLCGVLAVIMLVVNFIGYMASESFTEKAKFKEKFWGPIGGLLLALGAYAILVTINPALTGKEGLTVEQVGVTVEDQLALSYSGLDYTIYTKSVGGSTPAMPTGEELKQIQARYVSATQYVKSDYIPTLNKVLPNISKGAKTLMTAQTTIEGFKPGTKSYNNHNPGNLGTDWTKTKGFPTLEEGIRKQYEYITRVATGKHYMYPIGKRMTQPATMVGAHAYPAIDFNPYTGALTQYLNIYDAGTRTSNVYLNFIISFFAKEGMNISPSTTIQDIYKM